MITQILNKVKTTPVQVKWKDEEESVHTIITVPINSTLNIGKNVRNKMEANIYKGYQDTMPGQEAPHRIKRTRKPPTRNEDFLWI